MAWAENILFDSEGFRLQIPRWDFPDHGITCVLGESGSGKTTLLQILAGLIPDPSLRLSLEGQLISDLPPRARNFGFVFQDYALFPHLTVFENIAFAAEAKDIPPFIWSESAGQLVKRLGLEKIKNQRAHTLSGGEQQRVALARALVTKPRMVLLDEPLSALDEKIKNEARSLIFDLSREFQVPFIFVTHDLRDARLVSSALLLLSLGKVLAFGPTAEILKVPPTLEAARAISENQILDVALRDGQIFLCDHAIKVTREIPTDNGNKLVAKLWSFECVPVGQGNSGLKVQLFHNSDLGSQSSCQARLPDGQTLRAWARRDVQLTNEMDLNLEVEDLVLFKKA